MIAINPADIPTALRAIAGFDFAGAAAAIEQGNVDGIIHTLEDAAQIAVPFFPQAEGVEIGLVFAAFIYDGYRSGAIKSADPSDPAMQHADGPHSPNMDEG